MGVAVETTKKRKITVKVRKLEKLETTAVREGLG